jgi:hypothetical protein
MGKLTVLLSLRSRRKLIIRKPIVTSHFPSHPPSYPSVCIDAFNHAQSSQKQVSDPSTSTQGSLSPVIWVNTLNRLGAGVGMGGAGICHIQREGLRFLVPVGHEGKLPDHKSMSTEANIQSIHCSLSRSSNRFWRRYRIIWGMLRRLQSRIILILFIW